jgi:hypothetical protein
MVEIWKLLPVFLGRFEVHMNVLNIFNALLICGVQIELVKLNEKWKLNIMGFVKPSNRGVRLKLRQR